MSHFAKRGIGTIWEYFPCNRINSAWQITHARRLHHENLSGHHHHHSTLVQFAYRGRDHYENSTDLVTVCMHEMYHGLIHPVSSYTMHADADGNEFPEIVEDLESRWESFLTYETVDGRDCPLLESQHFAEAATGGRVYFYANGRRLIKVRARLEQLGVTERKP